MTGIIPKQQNGLLCVQSAEQAVFSFEILSSGRGREGQPKKISGAFLANY
ncbi:hypothetical protein [Fournierella sp.]